jgi:hypothetical protein
MTKANSKPRATRKATTATAKPAAPRGRPTKVVAQPAEAPAPARAKSKLDVVTGLLGRPDGATIAQLMVATGWQAHSVRGALAGALKKRGLTVTSEKIDGGRIYKTTAQATDA